MSNGLDDLERSREELIQSLSKENILRSKFVEEALRTIPRESFLWEGTPSFMAYFDEPLPLGETGQTISAPHMVVMMLEALELKAGLKVLEVGCGSGYNAALLGYIVGNKLQNPTKDFWVTSIERNGTLVEFARKNIEKEGMELVVRIVLGDGSLGFPQESTIHSYDRILVTAGAPRIPVYLKKQLRPGGILVVPVGQGHFQKLMKLKRGAGSEENDFKIEELVDCMFVPLVGADANLV